MYMRVNLTVKSHLESASGTGWVLAWAVAVTLDLDVGQLGDGDNRDGGVKSDAESVLCNLEQLLKTYSDDMLISGASKQISPFPPIFSILVSNLSYNWLGYIIEPVYIAEKCRIRDHKQVSICQF